MSLYRIDKLFDFEKGTLQSSKCEPGKYIFITASAEWKTHKDFSYDCEALVFAAAASGSLGRTHYVEGKFSASDLCFVLKPKDPENFPIDLKFYHIIFNELRSDIVRNTKAGTSKEAISLGNFAKYELPYFEIERQIAIKEHFVNAEETKESLITELDDQRAKVALLRQAILREAMQGKLVKQNSKEEPASELLRKIKAEKEKLINEKKLKKEKSLPEIEADEVPFEIPSSWAWCRLGEIGINFEYGTSQRADLNLSGIPVLRMNNIQDGKVIVENLKYVKKNIVDLPKLYLENGDILFNRTNSFELVGKSGVYKGDSNAMTFASYLIRIQFSEIFSPDFVNYYINSPICRESQIEPATIQQNGQANFNGTKLKNIITPIPPLAEQHRIVEKLNQLMQLCDDLEKSIQESKTHTGLLLQSALRDALKAKDSIQGCVVA